jgi:hypothetical protein
VKLGEKQELFARLLPLLLIRALQLGYQLRLKEIYRPPQMAQWNATHCARCGGTTGDPLHLSGHEFRRIGIRNSLHCDGLAIDFYLTRDGDMCWGEDAYLELGEFWEGLHLLTAWGGRFNDAGHFSIMDGGRK